MTLTVPRSGRRAAIALGASLAAHVAVVVAAVAVGLWQGLPLLGQNKLELVSVDVREIKELPLGPPPVPRSAPEGGGAKPKRKPRPRVPSPEAALFGGRDAGAGDAGAGDAGPGDAGTGVGDAAGDLRGYGDGGPPRLRDLRSLGPETSRLTALLRLDRLRASPEAPATIVAIDGLLKLLPDRRRLIDGTGLDLYRDFDLLLIATPNPVDDAVTFLAARHRLTDDAFKAAMDRAATAQGRAIAWSTEGGRPVGVRKVRAAVPGQRPDRDDRVLLLLARGLAIIAPPAYAALLLPETAVRLGVARPDAGAGPGAAQVGTARAATWRQLVERLDAHAEAMPADAIVMMTAVNLWRRRGGSSDPGSAPGAPAAQAPQVVLGETLPLPEVLNIVSGVEPTPFLEIGLQMTTGADAEEAERRLPGLKQRALTNPLLLLGGWTAIVARAQIRRLDETVTIRTTAAPQEMRRILLTITNLIQTARELR